MARRLAVPEKTETEDEREEKIIAPSKNDERWKLLEATIAQIEKKHGKGAIMKLTEMPARLLVDAIPTGAIELDIALGIGGIPRGRVTEIFGQEGSGKTTLAYHIIAELRSWVASPFTLTPNTP